MTSSPITTTAPIGNSPPAMPSSAVAIASAIISSGVMMCGSSVASGEAERLPGAVAVPAAVHRQRRAVDEAAAPTIGEERDGLRDVIGCGEPAERHMIG